MPGKYFTFFKFVDFIAKCSNAAYLPGNSEETVGGGLIDKLLVSEMVCLLLERMELSRGF